MGVITSLFAHKMADAAGPEIDAVPLLASIGLDHNAPWDPKAMISDTVYYDLLERIAERCDPTEL
ncbi:MAG: AraC family transcriptional regulator, partial [Pseudomonadota bacterium]